MNSGKTSSLIQSAYNYKEKGMNVLVFSSFLDNRYGENKVASRIGLEMQAIPFDANTNFYTEVHKHQDISAVFVDEAQFLTEENVTWLCSVVDLIKIPVLCYGLRTDCTGALFEGSKHLMALADEIEEIKSICFCGRKATMNFRLVDSDEQILIGGNDMYQSVCRMHFKEKTTK